MRYYQHQFQVKAPIKRVAEFHRGTHALKQLTPPPLIVKLKNVEPLADGSHAEFTLWLGPIPIYWKAVHSEVDPVKGFTDSQLEGPFKAWVHRHGFRQVSPDTTIIVDAVQGVPSDHLFWGIVSRFMWLTLPILFSYRARQTRKAVEIR